MLYEKNFIIFTLNFYQRSMNESLLRSDAIDVNSFGKHPLSIELRFVLSSVKIPFFLINNATRIIINL